MIVSKVANVDKFSLSFSCAPPYHRPARTYASLSSSSSSFHRRGERTIAYTYALPISLFCVKLPLPLASVWIARFTAGNRSSKSEWKRGTVRERHDKTRRWRILDFPWKREEKLDAIFTAAAVQFCYGTIGTCWWSLISTTALRHCMVIMLLRRWLHYCQMWEKGQIWWSRPEKSQDFYISFNKGGGGGEGGRWQGITAQGGGGGGGAAASLCSSSSSCTCRMRRRRRLLWRLGRRRRESWRCCRRLPPRRLRLFPRTSSCPGLREATLSRTGRTGIDDGRGWERGGGEIYCDNLSRKAEEKNKGEIGNRRQLGCSE